MSTKILKYLIVTVATLIATLISSHSLAADNVHSGHEIHIDRGENVASINRSWVDAEKKRAEVHNTVASYPFTLAPTSVYTDTPYATQIFTLTVTNNDIATDIFWFTHATASTSELPFPENLWNVVRPTSMTIGAGASAVVPIAVEIPATETKWITHTATISVTSQNHGTVVTSTLTTFTGGHWDPVDSRWEGCRFDFSYSGAVSYADSLLLYNLIGRHISKYEVHHFGQIVYADVLQVQSRLGITCVDERPSPPPRPADPHCSADDGVWQNGCNDPDFTWNGTGDIDGYYVYWGTNPRGTSSTYIATASYEPDPVNGGEYYLRVKTKNEAGYASDWKTLFEFKYDEIEPNNPTTLTETHGVQDGVWQNSVGDPDFTWSGASDDDSGVDGYYVYFGNDPDGISSTHTLATSHDPDPVSDGEYYLRVQTRDIAGNLAEWETLTEFKYDVTVPTFSVITETLGLTSGKCQSTHSQPTFAWQANDASSGVAEVFETSSIDNNSFGPSATHTISYTASISDMVTFQPVDAVGNAGDEWTFTFCYIDPGSPPDSPEDGAPTTPTLTLEWPAEDQVGSGADCHSTQLHAPLSGGGEIFGESYLEEYEVEVWYTGIGGEQVLVDHQYLSPAEAETWDPYMPYPGFYELKVKARAQLTDDSWFSSGWVTATYGFDDEAPSAPLLIDVCGLTSGEWSNQECLTASWPAVADWPEGVSHYSWCLATGACTPDIATTLTSTTWITENIGTDGEYRVRVMATDLVSNTSDVTEFIYRLDRTDPDLTCTGSPAPLVNEIISLAWTASDIHSGLNYHTITVGPYNYSIPSGVTSWAQGFPDGTYEVTLAAYDMVDNVTSLSPWMVEVDGAPPTITASNVDDGSAQTSSFTATISAADANLITNDDWRAGELSDSTSSPVWTASLASEGVYTVEVQVTDEVGNYSDWLSIGQAVYDVTPPTPPEPPEPPVDPGGATSEPIFTLPDDPSISHWRLILSTGETLTVTVPPFAYTLPLTTSGVYTVSVQACDEYNNCTADPDQIYAITFDNVSPLVEIGAPTGWVGASHLVYTVAVTDDMDTDILAWYCQGNGCAPNLPLDGEAITWDVSSSGEYVVGVKALDDAHNEGIAHAAVQVDLDPPIIDNLSIDGGGWWQQTKRTPVFSWSARDDQSGLGEFVAVVEQTGETDLNLTLPATDTQYMAAEVPIDFEGTVVFNLTASDQASPPWQSGSTQSTFYYDGKAPLLSTECPVEQGWQNEHATTQVTVEATDNGSGISWLRTCTTPPCTPDTDVPGDGRVHLSATSEQTATLVIGTADIAGNTAPQATFTLRFDDTSPRLALSGIPVATNIPTITVTAIADDVALAEAYVTLDQGGEEISRCTDLNVCVFNLSEEITYTVRLAAQDAAGNSAWEEASVCLDSSGPNVSISAPAQVSLADDDFEVSWDAPDATNWRFSVGGVEQSTGAGISGSATVHIPSYTTTLELLVEAQDNLDNPGSELVSTQVVADLDEDGMDDDWERDNGFNWNEPDDASGDPDSDGLTNLGEFQADTDPSDPDSDGDGLNDGDEVHDYGTDPTDPDSDDDDLDDGWEVEHGTDPLVPTNQDSQMILAVSPAEQTVVVGQTARVEISAINISEVPLDTSLTVEFPGGSSPNGASEGWDVEEENASRPLTLTVGGSVSHTLSLVWNTTGEHQLAVTTSDSEVTSTVHVSDPGWLVLENVTHPDQAHPGEGVSIEASLRNVSDAPAPGAVFDIRIGGTEMPIQRDLAPRELWSRKEVYTVPAWSHFPAAVGAHVDVEIEAAQGYAGEIEIVGWRFDFSGSVTGPDNNGVATYLLQATNSGNQAGTMVARVYWPISVTVLEVIGGNAWVEEGTLIWQESSQTAVGESCYAEVTVRIDENRVRIASNSAPTVTVEPSWGAGNVALPKLALPGSHQLYLPLVVKDGRGTAAAARDVSRTRKAPGRKVETVTSLPHGK